MGYSSTAGLVLPTITLGRSNRLGPSDLNWCQDHETYA